MKHFCTYDSGLILFHSKKEAQAQFPDCKYEQVTAGNFMWKGWLALDRHSTESNGILRTPDNRQLPVVSGWSEKGCLIGQRGMVPQSKHADEWKAIMDRVINLGLQPERPQ